MEELLPVLLGIVQGVLEWLPVSSSGVIMVILILFKLPSQIAYDTALYLHLGTAIAGITYYRRIFYRVFIDLLKLNLNNIYLRFILITTLLSIAVALPTYIIFRELISEIEGNIVMSIIGTLLLGIAVLLRKAKRSTIKEFNEMTLRDMILYGIVQGLSVLPGISRSGVTLAVMLTLGFNPTSSLTASFLSAPIVSILTCPLICRSFNPLYLTSLVISAITGVIAIRAMLTLSRKFKIEVFTIIIATTILITSIVLTISMYRLGY